MSVINPKLAEAVAAAGVPVSAELAPEPGVRTLNQVEDELTGVSLALYEEELRTARLRLALESARRRALRRLPHEREGLIFHLERENRQLHAFVRVANEAAQVSARGWEQYSAEVTQLREENARLRAHIAVLEAQRERRRLELVALRNDALGMRGTLAPNGEDSRVPFVLGETLTPAVEWLVNRVAELEAVEPVVFRAAHDSIVMGYYSTDAEARKHCEANVRQEEPAGSILHMSWSADDIGDDAEYELHITPAKTGGLIRGTGYVVTPIEISAAFDAAADE